MDRNGNQLYLVIKESGMWMFQMANLRIGMTCDKNLDVFSVTNKGVDRWWFGQYFREKYL